MCNDLKVDIQRNILKHFENTMVMCWVYNGETLEKLIKTVHALHNRQYMYEKLFVGQITIILKCMVIVVYNIML